MNRMRYALFYNRTNGTAEVTVEPVHAVAIRIEVEVIGADGIALVGRRAPTAADLSNGFKRRIVTIARGGKEDGLAVLTGDFVAVMATLCRPCPGTLGFQLFEFCLCRQSPRAAPLGTRYIVRGIAADVTHTLAVGFAIVLGIARLCGSFSPGVVVTIVGGSGGADIACRPLHAEAQVYVSMVIDKAIRLRYLH